MSAPLSQTADYAIREQALDPTRSFIVEAPAGSGKTELLTRRYLRLLAVVRVPEEILAITFTRKAAAEMRNRVFRALALADSATPPDKPMELAIWPLARAARAADATNGWQLLQHPSRLRIMTIDALNSSLAKQLPILSGAGASLAIARDSKSLYSDVVLRLIERLSTRSEAADTIARLLHHLDNQYGTLKTLLAKELARREYWLDLGLLRFDMPTLRGRLEATLDEVVTQELALLHKMVPGDVREELVTLAAFAGTVLNSTGSESGIAACDSLIALPAASSDALAQWKGLVELLLTKDDEWRLQPNIKTGFPPAEKTTKKRMEALLQRLQRESALKQVLARARDLPGPSYSDAQWQVLTDLLKVLRLAVTELEVVMRERGEADYMANAIAARRSLGTVTEPTDLALRLDYRLRHLLVDEFQDTSRGQAELLALLTAGWNDGDGRTLFCVGDPMQSIYRFRNAEVGLFLNLKRQGLNQLRLTPLRLSVNFRSTKPVMAWINQTFAQVLPQQDDPERGAVTFTSSEAKADADEIGGVFVHAIVGDKDAGRSEEAKQIGALIAQTHSARPKIKIAVLVNNRSHLQWVIRELHARGIAFQAVEIDPLVKRAAIQDLIALTRAIAHLADRTAWLAILRAPWCGLALADLHVLCAAGSSTTATLWQVLNDPVRLNLVSGDAQERIARIKPTLQNAFEGRGRMSLRDCIERAWHALGGPATLTTAAALFDAGAYFDRLELIERNGDIEDIATLENLLGDLYASADTSSETHVELMTIHRAKGLEFDVVILPALDSGARREDSPLLRAYELPILDEQALLLAPIAARGDEPDAIYKWLAILDQQRERFERGRLLYVAATRAKQELHVFGVLGPGSKPRADTFLQLLWPHVEPTFAIQVELAAPASIASHASSIGVRTQRLPLSWAGPAPLQSMKVGVLRDVVGAAPLHPEFEWAGETARHVGTLVHREIERITGSDGDSGSTRQSARHYAIELAELGVPPHLRDVASERVREALTQMLNDDRGRWLLWGNGTQMNGHREAASELALSGVVDGEIFNGIIDRTFVTHDGTRWIVDFKTSSHEGGGVEDFLSREVDRYRAQLQRYAKLMRGYRPDEPIKAALYFPLLKAWREVAL